MWHVCTTLISFLIEFDYFLVVLSNVQSIIIDNNTLKLFKTLCNVFAQFYMKKATTIQYSIGGKNTKKVFVCSSQLRYNWIDNFSGSKYNFEYS
jgi:hypothetical protein